jgi:hypothetical protein
MRLQLASGLNVIGLCAIGDIISSGGPSSLGNSGALEPESQLIMALLPDSRKMPGHHFLPH